ncbi:MAG: hypothetical protein J1F05_00790 [Muribaculaceae bacterium]|nr:hypothetical protein [Muribaculaceae bacterium]
MSEENPREELYRRFRASLSQPVLERFFDEDELVELYDYAGDIDDDYVQMEVLFCGARLYPESTALAERRALLYLDTTIGDSDKPSPAAGAFLADNPDCESPLFDIVRLETTQTENIVDALDFILNQYDKFSDEEIIRFVDLASSHAPYEWLKNNLDRLREKIDYQPALLYEVIQEADLHADHETAIKLAEELIETDPFTVGYWIRLFRAQARLGKEDDAKSTFDYAKVLGSDKPDALMTLIEEVYNSAPYLYHEAFEILETLKAEFPEEFLYVDFQCALLVKAGDASKAISLLKHFLDHNPDNAAAMRQLLVCNVPDCGIYYERFLKTAEEYDFDDEIINGFINQLSLNSASYSIDAMVGATKDINEIDPDNFSAWIEALFSLQKFDRIVEVVDKYNYIDNIVRVPLKGTAFIYAYIVSMMKLGLEQKANEFIDKIRPLLEAMISDVPMPIRMAIRTLFTLVDKIRQHPSTDKLYWEYFDMLHYSKFQ